VEQSSGRSWVFVVVSREVWGLRDGTPTNKKKNTNKQEKTPTNKKKTPTNKKKNTNKQGKHLSSKENAFQARGIFRSNVKVCKW
jgi:hypothetical protein